MCLGLYHLGPNTPMSCRFAMRRVLCVLLLFLLLICIFYTAGVLRKQAAAAKSNAAVAPRRHNRMSLSAAAALHLRRKSQAAARLKHLRAVLARLKRKSSDQLSHAVADDNFYYPIGDASTTNLIRGKRDPFTAMLLFGGLIWTGVKIYKNRKKKRAYKKAMYRGPSISRSGGRGGGSVGGRRLSGGGGGGGGRRSSGRRGSGMSLPPSRRGGSPRRDDYYSDEDDYSDEDGYSDEYQDDYDEDDMYGYDDGADYDDYSGRGGRGRNRFSGRGSLRPDGIDDDYGEYFLNHAGERYFRDEDGEIFYIDPKDGEPIYFDSDDDEFAFGIYEGRIVRVYEDADENDYFKDRNGNPYYIGPNGMRYYMNSRHLRVERIKKK